LIDALWQGQGEGCEARGSLVVVAAYVWAMAGANESLEALAPITRGVVVGAADAIL